MKGVVGRQGHRCRIGSLRVGAQACRARTSVHARGCSPACLVADGRWRADDRPVAWWLRCSPPAARRHPWHRPSRALCAGVAGADHGVRTGRRTAGRGVPITTRISMSASGFALSMSTATARSTLLAEMPQRDISGCGETQGRETMRSSSRSPTPFAMSTDLRAGFWPIGRIFSTPSTSTATASFDLFIGRVQGTVDRFEQDGVSPSGAHAFSAAYGELGRDRDPRSRGDRWLGDSRGRSAIPDKRARSRARGAGLQHAVAHAGPHVTGRTPSPSPTSRAKEHSLDLFLWGDFFEAGLLQIENTGSCCAQPFLQNKPFEFPPAHPVSHVGVQCADVRRHQR